ncbi:alpha/beta hydrolase [Sphingomonas sp. BK235]|uniref:alpha/beta fold hydrolase n=1 Tax=Sphingomonas sp. BK235 TaxID=2512131 RepID=UPI0010D67717|nr:alpha/beta hydrolase [Sphingomonas sp. BK235]TCP30125.1 pimeloyl-ACP methyl ester carboxylesterase [Sphingomonas sp. BK235]
MEAVAAAGYRAIALDMRGYGGSSKPDDAEAYTILQCVGDLVGVLKELNVEQAVVVGHDFGAAISWHAAMMRSDLFRAVFCLSVPPMLPNGGPSFLEQIKSAGHDDFYMFHQMRPEADKQWADAATTVLGMLYWTSGLPAKGEGWNPLDPAEGLKRPSPVGLPSFVEKADWQATIADLGRNGFHGPLNYYRALQPYFDQAGAFAGARVVQPSFFVVGSEDGVAKMRAVTRDEVAADAPDLRGFLTLDGIGHWPQLEASDQVNQALLEFLAAVEG